MHRFLWDLRWSSSGTDEIEEDEGFGAPRGPRVAPGSYQVKLTVDGQTFTHNFKVEMDPRSQATQAELDQQQRLGLEIFGEVRRARRALAEIGAVKKRLGEVKPQLAGKNPELLTQVTSIEKAITTIEKGSQAPIATMGLETASTGTGIGAARGGRRRSDGAVASHRTLSPVGRSGESGNGRVDEAEEHSVGSAQ